MCQVAYSIAALVSLISLYLKVKILVEQLRKRRTEIELDDEESAGPLKRHKDRLIKTHRTLRLIFASMMIGFAEVCRQSVKTAAFAASLIISRFVSHPTGMKVTTVCLCAVPAARHPADDVYVEDEQPWFDGHTVVRAAIAALHLFSHPRLCRLVTTWLQFGMKIEKIGEIPSLWKYRTKQKQKVVALEAILAKQAPSHPMLLEKGTTPLARALPQIAPVELQAVPERTAGIC